MWTYSDNTGTPGRKTSGENKEEVDRRERETITPPLIKMKAQSVPQTQKRNHVIQKT